MKKKTISINAASFPKGKINLMELQKEIQKVDPSACIVTASLEERIVSGLGEPDIKLPPEIVFEYDEGKIGVADLINKVTAHNPKHSDKEESESVRKKDLDEKTAALPVIQQVLSELADLRSRVTKLENKKP